VLCLNMPYYTYTKASLSKFLLACKHMDRVVAGEP